MSTNVLLNEELIGLSALAKKVPSHRHAGKRGITAVAVWRWVVQGVRAHDGRIVKLETVKLAGRYLTSWAAFQRFIEAQSPQQTNVLPTPARSPGKRARAARKATAELQAAGF